MPRFEHQFVCRQGQLRVFGVQQAFGLRFEAVELVKQPGHVAVFEIVGRLLHFVLAVHVAISERRALRRDGPHQIIHVFNALQIHGQTFDAVSDFAEHGRAVDTADLLEIGELGHFHAVEPYFPAQAPCAERWVFPVVFHKADVVHGRVDAQFLQAAQIQILNIVGRGFERDLELVIMLQAVRVVAVAAVFRAAAGLHIGHIPRFGTQRAQTGGRVRRARAHFDIERLDDRATLICPISLQFKNDLLESQHNVCP